MMRKVEEPGKIIEIKRKEGMKLRGFEREGQHKHLVNKIEIENYRV